MDVGRTWTEPLVSRQPGQHEAAPSDDERGHGDPDGSSLLGGLDTLTQNATLAQLEALANHKQLSQSRHLIKAILTRITADVHDRTVVEGWDVAEWEHYFTKLEVRLQPCNDPSVTHSLLPAPHVLKSTPRLSLPAAGPGGTASTIRLSVCNCTPPPPRLVG